MNGATKTRPVFTRRARFYSACSLVLKLHLGMPCGGNSIAGGRETTEQGVTFSLLESHVETCRWSRSTICPPRAMELPPYCVTKWSLVTRDTAPSGSDCPSGSDRLSRGRLTLKCPEMP